MRRPLILIALLVYAFNSSAQVQSWTSLTSKKSVESLWAYQGVVWGGTPGGLLALDPETGTFAQWTNTEGLNGTAIAAMAGDESGMLWIGFENGMLQSYAMEEQTWQTYTDFQAADVKIHSMTMHGDSLFIGLDIGVSLFRLSKSEVSETYRRLGNAIQAETPVNDILITHDAIWAATDLGLARASIDETNLLDPQNWSNATTAEGLPHDRVIVLLENDGEIWAGTQGGVARYDGAGWISVSSGLNQLVILDLAIVQQNLYALTSEAVYQLENDTWIRKADVTDAFCFERFENALMIGHTLGMNLYNTLTSEMTSFTPNCPRDNRFADMHVDGHGVLWCASAALQGTGFSSYDGETWTNYDRETIGSIRYNDFCSVTSDTSGNVWAGTWGAGIARVNFDSTFSFYNVQNGFLQGISSSPNYAVVPDMTCDNYGNIWILNYRAVNGNSLLSVTPQGEWTTYGSAYGINSTLLSSLAVDSYGRIFVGSETSGVMIVNPSGTANTPGDDPNVIYLRASDGLESLKINALAADQEGGVYIGTTDGLYHYWNGFVTRRYGLPSENVQAVLVDGVNNLWVGTTLGLTFFSEEYYWGKPYTAENSLLVNNNVVSLAMNYETGTLYAGTNYGCSCIETPYSKPLDSPSDLDVYPNPFIAARDGQLTIDNLTYDVAVNIYSSSGYLVKHFSESDVAGKKLFWDGRDKHGKPVASGIYFVMAGAVNGKAKVAKFAIIR